MQYFGGRGPRVKEGLVMFDKEIKVFYKTKQLKVKTQERKLQLVWDKIL